MEIVGTIVLITIVIMLIMSEKQAYRLGHWVGFNYEVLKDKLRSKFK